MSGNKIIIETSPKFSNLLQGRFEGDAKIERIALDVYCEGNHSETVYLKKEDGGGFQSVIIRPCATKMEVKPRPVFDVVIAGTDNEAPMAPPIQEQEPAPAQEPAPTREKKIVISADDISKLFDRAVAVAGKIKDPLQKSSAFRGIAGAVAKV